MVVHLSISFLVTSHVTTHVTTLSVNKLHTLNPPVL